MLRRADAVVGVSDGIVQALKRSGVAEDRLLAIPNGIPGRSPQVSTRSLREELGVGQRALIGAVGRLETQKGHTFLLEAARALLQRWPEVLFVIAGEGSQRAVLEQQIRALGLERQVKLLGRRSDMEALYAALDLFVMPSLDEGTPMVLLEAMRAGLPVIATRVGGVPQLIRAGETGVLVEPEDTAALAGAMQRCLADALMARRLGAAAAREIRERHSAEAMESRYRALYDRIASKRGAPARVQTQEAWDV